MEQATSWIPGHLPLAAGKSITLEPRDCGVLKVGAGRLRIGTHSLETGERVRLWRGDRVELANSAESTAMFSWDACMQQPSLMERLARWFS